MDDASPESWAEIEGFPYFVSDQGRVKNAASGRVLDPGPHPSGYVYVSLVRDKAPHRHPVHRLVAKAFIPNATGAPVVNHINGIRADNRAANLEWATHSENAQKRVFPRHGPRVKPVDQLLPDGGLVKTWGSMREAADSVGVAPETLARYVGDARVLKGFLWRATPSPAIEGEEWRAATVGGRNIAVSSCGRVRAKDGGITYGSMRAGYMVYGSLFVHRIVAEAFCSRRGGADVVNHRDGNKSHNSATNLEWVTQRENVVHAVQTGRRPAQHLRGCRSVCRVLANGELEQYPSARAAAAATGACAEGIALTCLGRHKTAGGSKWVYTDSVTPSRVPMFAPAEMDAYVEELLDLVLSSPADAPTG